MPVLCYEKSTTPAYYAEAHQRELRNPFHISDHVLSLKFHRCTLFVCLKYSTKNGRRPGELQCYLVHLAISQCAKFQGEEERTRSCLLEMRRSYSLPSEFLPRRFP